MPIVIYHNPRCSKSRATLALLQENGHSPKIVEYLKCPPDVETVFALANKLEMHLAGMVRTGEKEFKEMNLAGADDDTLAVAISEHPILLQRPIVVSDDRAAIGRPPENVLNIL